MIVGNTRVCRIKDQYIVHTEIVDEEERQNKVPGRSSQISLQQTYADAYVSTPIDSFPLFLKQVEAIWFLFQRERVKPIDYFVCRGWYNTCSN